MPADIKQIESLLKADARSLLGHTCKAIPKKRIAEP